MTDSRCAPGPLLVPCCPPTAPWRPPVVPLAYCWSPADLLLPPWRPPAGHLLPNCAPAGLLHIATHPLTPLTRSTINSTHLLNSPTPLTHSAHLLHSPIQHSMDRSPYRPKCIRELATRQQKGEELDRCNLRAAMDSPFHKVWLAESRLVEWRRRGV